MVERKKSSNWAKLIKSDQEFEMDSTENKSEDQIRVEGPPVNYDVFIIAEKGVEFDFVRFIADNFFGNCPVLNEVSEENFIHEKEIFCGNFTKEVAESKVIEVLECSRTNKFSLRCIMRRGKAYASKKS